MLARLQAALRRLLFLDVSPLIKLGRRKVLTAEDMPPLPAHLDPRRSSEGFLRLPLDNAWHFLAACIRAVRPRWLRVLALACLMLGGELLSPQLVFQILSYIEQAARGASPLWVGLVWASCLVATSIVHALVMQHYFYQALSLVGETTNGLNFRIYRRALTLNRHERLTRPTGDLVNLMGSDAEAVAQFSWVSIEVGYALALIVGATFMLFRFIGVAAFAALGVLILMAPLTRLLGKRFVHIDGQLMAARDCRVTMIAQLLNGIRIVKYFTWEAKVLADVGEARKQELAHKKRLIIAESFSLLLYASTNSLVSLAAFACHIWLGHSLDAATIFACIGLFIAMEHPFGNLTELLGHSATARVSAIRLMHFLDDPTETVGSEEALPSTVATAAPAAACELSLSGLTAAYPDAPGRPVLADIELHIKSGECVALVGPVGSGKSSLLLAILGELGETAGEIRFGNAQDGQGRPRIAWVPQQAFICNRSLADNITLGGDPTRLDEAVYLACLNRDLSQLPAGLATEIGEQGINLSGGQKQRVALARAHLYDAPLVLLDDSLSAVDETTERQLMS